MMRAEQSIPQILNVSINDSFHRQNSSQQVINQGVYAQTIQNPIVNQSFRNNQNENIHLQQYSSPRIDYYSVRQC